MCAAYWALSSSLSHFFFLLSHHTHTHTYIHRHTHTHVSLCISIKSRNHRWEESIICLSEFSILQLTYLFPCKQCDFFLHGLEGWWSFLLRCVVVWFVDWLIHFQNFWFFFSVWILYRIFPWCFNFFSSTLLILSSSLVVFLSRSLINFITVFRIFYLSPLCGPCSSSSVQDSNTSTSDHFCSPLLRSCQLRRGLSGMLSHVFYSFAGFRISVCMYVSCPPVCSTPLPQSFPRVFCFISHKSWWVLFA